MPELGERDRQVVARLFAGATRPVRVEVYVVGRPEAGPKTGFRAAIAEVAELVPLLQVAEYGADQAGAAVERTPAVWLRDGDGGDLRVRFYGLPTGYEFSSLLAAAADAATPQSALQSATLEALAGLEQDVQIKVFSTPT